MLEQVWQNQWQEGELGWHRVCSHLGETRGLRGSPCAQTEQLSSLLQIAYVQTSSLPADPLLRGFPPAGNTALLSIRILLAYCHGKERH